MNKAEYELIAVNFCCLGQDADLLSLKTPLQKAKSFAFDLVSERGDKQKFFGTACEGKEAINKKKVDV